MNQSAECRQRITKPFRPNANANANTLNAIITKRHMAHNQQMTFGSARVIHLQKHESITP